MKTAIIAAAFALSFLAAPVHAGECDDWFVKVYVKVGSSYQFYRNYSEADDAIAAIAANPGYSGYVKAQNVCVDGWQFFSFSNGRVRGL